MNKTPPTARREHKLRWRTRPYLLNDAKKLLGMTEISLDAHAMNSDVAVCQNVISEKQSAGIMSIKRVALFSCRAGDINFYCPTAVKVAIKMGS